MRTRRLVWWAAGLAVLAGLVYLMATASTGPSDPTEEPPMASAAPPPSIVRGVDFVSLPTRDLEASVRFYTEVLGLRCSVHMPERHFAEFEPGTVTIGVMQAEAMGLPYQPNRNPIALHVDDVAGEHGQDDLAGAAAAGEAGGQRPATQRDGLDGGAGAVGGAEGPAVRGWCLAGPAGGEGGDLVAGDCHDVRAAHVGIRSQTVTR